MFRKHRVLIVGPLSPPSGGIQTLIKAQLGSALGDRFQLESFDTGKRTRPDRWLVTGLLSQLRIIGELTWRLIRFRPHIVHIHVGGFPEPFRRGIDALISRCLGRKVVLHINSGDFDKAYPKLNSVLRRFVQLVFGLSHRVLACSSYWAEYYRQFVAEQKIVVVFNGIQGEPYRSRLPEKQDARQRLGVPSDAFLWILLGVMGHRKGVFDLCQVLPKVTSGSKVLFALIGPDESNEAGATAKLQRLCRQNDVSEHVVFPGEVDATGRCNWLGAADAYILPSHSENSPLSLLEAMAAGLPILSTRVGSIPEMLPDASHAVLIEAGDLDALAEGCRWIMADEARRLSMADRNRCRFREHFDIDVGIAPVVGRLYDELLRHEPR